MKLKKYLVNSVDEALFQIKRDLGEDAYILSTKKVMEKGSLNLSNRAMIEVTAATDDSGEARENISKNLLNKKYGVAKPEIVDENLIAPTRKKDIPRINPVEKDQTLEKMSFMQNELLPLKQEIEEIRLLLRKTDSNMFSTNIDFKGIYLEIFLDLMEKGVEKKMAKKIVDTLVFQITGISHDNHEIKKKVFGIITALIGNPSPIKLLKGQRKIIVLVGPTGVGKTTTIAKLASYYKLMESKRVALITNDNYRIGAEAHLSTYAKIINVPFFSVYDKKDIRFRLNELKGFDVVFIDTTGRSSTDTKGLEEIDKIVKEIPETEREIMLILSASTKTEDLKNIYKKYSIFNPEKFIFSKLDETLNLGNLFNLKMESDIPVAYFTTGQQVPEDIEIAYPRRFASKILSLTKNIGGAYESSSRIV